MKPSTMQPTDSIGQFLAAQAARLNAEAEAAPAGTGYSRRINSSRWVTNPDGAMTHLRVTCEATNDEEEWCRRHDPLRGLNAEGIKAYEQLYHEAGPGDIEAKLEDRDYYKEVNAFWVPESARWEALRAAAKQPDIGKRIDDALTQIEQENPKLKGILDKRYARAQLPDGKLGELVDLVSTIGFGDNPSTARDILGQVYEYFLGMFASAEGKRGGQFYTPTSIVKTLVAILNPHSTKN
jgi:hypothetical protein